MVLLGKIVILILLSLWGWEANVGNGFRLRKIAEVERAICFSAAIVVFAILLWNVGRT